MNTVGRGKMPNLARNLIDSNAVQTFADWINSMGATPALAPPVLAPASGIFTNGVILTLQPPDGDATLYYTWTAHCQRPPGRSTPGGLISHRARCLRQCV